MRILELSQTPHRPIDAHGSQGFSVGAFGITAESHLVMVRLAPRGWIGRHPAAGRQLLVVIEGDAIVSGGDGVDVEIGVGQAAVWEPDEQHATRSRSGLVAMVVEGDLDLGTPGEQVDPGDV